MAKTVNRPLEIAERSRPRPQMPPALAAMPLLRWEVVLFAALVAVAAAMRFWDLGSRAYHHDESLHAVYSWYLYVGRGYEHNPMMHGPFQFIVNTLVFTLFTASDYTGRILYALFGSALVGTAFFLRPYLGRAGALCVAGLLAFSPTMLYFSRFARNDILIALWTLGLVFCMWRYMDERRTGYLYGFAALLALSFSTQENTYLHVIILGLFLGIVSLAQVLATWRRVGFDGLARIHKRFGLRRLSPPATLLLLLLTLTLPVWAAGISILQKPLGIVLASDASSGGPIGLPDGRGNAVALVAVGLGLVVGAYAGTLWHRRRWLICAGIYWAIFVTLFSTVFTYPTGVATGVWQSLGYWLAQQDVARGGQPWYYYFVLLPIYEFLPLVFALAGMVYYWFKGDAFSWFLTFWIIMAFALYAWAAEKMPWISVHLALPLVLMAGKLLGDVLERIPWRRAASSGAAWLLVLLPLAVVALGSIVAIRQWAPDANVVLRNAAPYVALAVLLYLGYRIAERTGLKLTGQVVVIGLAGILAVFSVRAAVQVSYKNGDVPVEMLVYTQTSPDVPKLVQDIERVAWATGEGRDMRITVDGADGFVWPWAWYLRDYKNVAYTDIAPNAGPLGRVVLANASNESKMQPYMDGYRRGQRYSLRWWFPEDYRGLTLERLWGEFANRDKFLDLWRYWMFRDLKSKLGSADAIAYFAKDVPGLALAPFDMPSERVLAPGLTSASP